MDQDIEVALRTLNSEFRTIKNSLEPLSAEFKKLNSLEIELQKLKSEMIPKIKNLELRSRDAIPSKNTLALAVQYKNLEAQLSKIRTDMSAFRKKPLIDKEQDSALRLLSENQSIIDVKLRKINSDFENKYKKQLDSNREMIVNVISENNALKRELEKNSMELEKVRKEFGSHRTIFQERDTQLTKDVNVRKRHINQIVDELNEARKKIHLNGTVSAETQEKIDDIRSQLAKLKNDLQNIEKSNSTKVDLKDIEDTKLSFSRLEKRTISDLGEIKARMRELERKIVGKKDIDRIQAIVQDLQINEINKLKEEFMNLSVDMSKLPTHVETKLSNLKRVMSYIELIKSDVDKLSTRISSSEDKTVEINRMKRSIDELNKKIENASEPNEEIKKQIRHVEESVRADQEHIKKEHERIEHRIDKLSESSADLGLLQSIKKDVANAIVKADRLDSTINIVEKITHRLETVENRLDTEFKNVTAEMNRINIKAENTFKILKDLDKVL